LLAFVMEAVVRVRLLLRIWHEGFMVHSSWPLGSKHYLMKNITRLMKIFFSQILLILSCCFVTKAQSPNAHPDGQQMLKFQDSLVSLGFDLVNKETEPDRITANYTFIKTLVGALKTQNSFNFTFDSLKTVSVLPSPDGTFRIFSWYVQNDDESYRYYGTIQMRTPDGKLQLFPLVDYTPFMKSAADTVTTNDKWYGAKYYTIIPVTRNVRSPYYILLGWKGNNIESTKRVIEVLSFKDGKAYFGMPVFDGDKDRPNKQRIIFEYSKQVSMILNYVPEDGRIVFDHLAPPDPNLKGKFDSYGPDMSYDGFRLLNGRWRLVEDLQLKNPPSATDGQFNDPRKPPKYIPKL